MHNPKLSEAMRAYLDGNHKKARTLLQELIREEPNNEAAWQQFIYLAKDDAERDQIIEQVLTINPENKLAYKLKMQKAFGGSSTPEDMIPEKVEIPENPKSNVYQMLWDCEYCGSNKLLGVTHRFCPNCGAAQNPDKRYFPSDEDKVKVEDHIYHGADKICPSCNTTSSAAAEFCMQCGTPLGDAKQALTRGVRRGSQFAQGEVRDLKKEKFEAQVQSFAAAKKGSFSIPALGWGALVVVILAVVCGGIYFLFFAKREAAVVVTGHEWERTVDVERFQEVDEEDWCDSLPGDADVTRRYDRVRDTEKVEVGESCEMQQVDQGDGTFREEEVCEPVYEERDVMDDFCEYEVERWVVVDTEAVSGNLNVAPFWPQVSLSRTGECLGCERQGDQHETYTVIFREEGSKKEYRCEFSLEKWRGFSVESRWILKVGQVAGGPDCDDIQPAS